MTQSRPDNASGNQPSTLRQGWRTYRFHLNVLLILIPLAFIPTYFSDFAKRQDSRLDEHTLGEIDVGLCSVMLMRQGTPNARSGAVEQAIRFTAALSDRCRNDVKATYLHVGKSTDPRTTVEIFSGTPNRMTAEVTLPREAGRELWITMIGWDATVHQARVAMDQASTD
jgi:hypothetical protein